MTMAPARVAIVTGTARGIGRAIVRHLAEQGRKVGGADLPTSRLTRAFPARRRNVLTIEADVADEPVPRMADKSAVRR
jgi:NAD(P)-dependent dehydrogenase (short-subunit alcohol dehydrogenase family)